MVDALSVEQLDPLALLERFFQQAPEPQLTRQDFAHIRRDYRLLVGYLKNAVLYETDGVNLLIYGVPGTGKTELVRTLATEAGLQLFEINAQKDSGDSFDLDYRPSAFGDRFSTYQLSQSVLGGKRDCVLLFDEIEDVFPVIRDPMFGTTSSLMGQKARTNRLLETKPVPTFWLSNEVGQIDPAFLRRFDYVLELKNPGRAYREGVFKKVLRDLPVREEWISQVAETDYLVPAILERAARVVGHLDESDPEMVEHT